MFRREARLSVDLAFGTSINGRELQLKASVRAKDGLREILRSFGCQRAAEQKEL